MYDLYGGMFENINLVFIYVSLGFAVAYLALEIAWHYTACRLPDKSIKPCVFKQVKIRVARNQPKIR
jgi:hypothetical protein